MQKMPNKNKVDPYENFGWQGQMQEMQEEITQASKKEIIK